jgi:gamma-glutamyl phosphate reductase
MLMVMGQSAKRAARILARTKSEQKNEALRRLARALGRPPGYFIRQ